MKPQTPSFPLDNLLIDTWWFGLSARLDDERFEALARQRVREGFNAVQLVAGIPPEVAPGHPQARSSVGVPWDLKGNINEEYLRLARSRIQRLNQWGLRVVVLGGWGMQIDWMGVQFMKRWWQGLIDHLDDLDVVYCVSGEVDLWVDMPGLLLPDRSTDDLKGHVDSAFSGPRRYAEKVAKKLFRLKTRLLKPYAERHRQNAWGQVSAFIAQRTEHPLIAHTGGLPGTHSHVLISHPELLAAITVQTGHDQTSRTLHWQLPMQLSDAFNLRFINLEPWYEGIRDDFYSADQLYAYWCNMLSGACSFAYGAHGVWNVGDGKFLAHWGAQSLEQAMALPTGRLLGQSHAWFLGHQGYDPLAETVVDAEGGQLMSIVRKTANGSLTFYPEARNYKDSSDGLLFDPLLGEEVDNVPLEGSVVIWNAAA